ncbi:MAG: HAD hydrolase-like protein [Candidatus Uhrbacteria bacterium]
MLVFARCGSGQNGWVRSECWIVERSALSNTDTRLRVPNPLAHQETFAMHQHNTTPDRVDVLCIDAIGTIFSFRYPREVLVSRFLELHFDVCVTPESIKDQTRQLLQRFPRGIMTMDEHWEKVINPRLWMSFGITGNQRHKIREMRRWMFGTPEHFWVEPAMHGLIREFVAREDVRIVITSNHDRKTLTKLLHAHDLDECFPRESIFTSHEVKYTKPDPQYWEQVRRSLQIVEIEHLALVGNSLQNDGDSARIGIRVAILDWTGSLNGVVASLPAGMTAVSTIDEMWTWLVETCGISYNGNGADTPRLAACGG